MAREKMARKKQHDYDDIPGTYVFDAERSRQGFGINMFCMSLMKDENRKAFKANEAEYLKNGKALDESGNPCPVPPVILKTKEERRRYREAGERRKARLAGRKGIR